MIFQKFRTDLVGGFVGKLRVFEKKGKNFAPCLEPVFELAKKIGYFPKDRVGMSIACNT